MFLEMLLALHTYTYDVAMYYERGDRYSPQYISAPRYLILTRNNLQEEKD